MDDSKRPGGRAARPLRALAAVLAVAACWASARGQDAPLVVPKASRADFRFVVDGAAAQVRVDPEDSPSVQLAAGLFASGSPWSCCPPSFLDQRRE